MNILVTGGAGYIGSHTCVELLNEGHSVIIADNFINSNMQAIENIKKITKKDVIFYEVDVTEKSSVEKIFSSHKIDGVIHFAGLKAVGESVVKPLMYYYNNLVSTIALSEACIKYSVNKFVFSSSATVYGDNKVPFKEDMELLPTTNPYGETKAMCERILSDVSNTNSEFGVSLLRYFNPVGAHESGLIGEMPNGIPNNLMPFVTQVATGKREYLSVFGNDYDTIDGTGVRDYIHVVDLAKGHVKAIETLNSEISIYNLGTGKGTSVLEIVNAFEKVNNIEIPYKLVDRRPGDIASCYADATKAEKELGWIAKLSIEDMVRDSWKFESNIKKAER